MNKYKLSKSSQVAFGKPRDAIVNSNTYRSLQRHHMVSLPQHGFLVQAYISDHSNVQITQYMLFSWRHTNLGSILHRFGDMTAFMCSWPHPYSTLILGVFPLHQTAHVGVNVQLFGREIIFKVFQPMW